MDAPVDHLRKVEELFHAALDCDKAARPGFLDEACGGDRELRQEIESLLSHLDADDVLAQSVARVSLEAVETAQAAVERFGPWKVVKEIARGGMGAVFLANR